MKKNSIFSILISVGILVGCGGSSTNEAGELSVPLEPVVPAPVTSDEQNAVTQTDFSESVENFANPERGFYRAVSGGTLNQLTLNDVMDAYANGHRLMFARIDLEDYRGSAIPEQHLTNLREKLNLARTGGVKLILRAAYNNPQNETEYRTVQDAPLSTVLSHISQLEPLFRENSDVIAAVQAGFVGAWGEWHTSSNDLTTSANRTTIKDALLAAIPGDRFVQFRLPPYLVDWTPNLPDLSSALDGSFRMGFHNDCFLASETDVGTYSSNSDERASQRLFAQQLGDLGMFGGETCNPLDAPGSISRTSCIDIIREGADYKLTYLNSAYYRPDFHQNWITSGCMDEVSRSMGYRFELESAEHAKVAAAGNEFGLSFTVQNTGWARLYNPRALEIVFRNLESSEVRRFEAGGVDPRSWAPGIRVRQSAIIQLPQDLSAGNWELLFALPDASVSLSDDPRYSVRLANDADTQRRQYWDENLGAFALGTTVTVQ